MSYFDNTYVCMCVAVCARDNPALVAWPCFHYFGCPPSIQLAVESLINVNSKSVPYEVKRGLIIEYQCFCLFCNVPKKQQGSSE